MAIAKNVCEEEFLMTGRNGPETGAKKAEVKTVHIV